MDIQRRIKELGIELPEPPAKGGVYVPAKEFNGNLVYVSGCGPNIGDKVYRGKLGSTYSLEEGQKAAECCVLNTLAVLQKQLGDLNKVKQIVKILAFVASENDFYMQPQVANGASKLLCDIFGEKAGCPSRSAIGVNVLPGDLPIEIEMLIELID